MNVLIDAAKEILKLNAMNKHKIAIGLISTNYGLLEKSEKLKTENPQSKHYSFWKFHHEITGKDFFDVAKQFKTLA